MFSWGEDTSCGFGLRKWNDSNPVNLNNCINFSNLRSDLRDLSAGQKVVAFVRTDGKSSIVRIREDQDGRRFTGKLKSLNCEKIHAVSCGDDFVVLLSEEGKVLFMDSSNIVRPLKELCNIQVNQVACGDQHSIALTQDGQVFTWGMNTFGQLGLGQGTDGQRPPQVLHSLSGLPLIQVTTGGDHCFALSVSGAVFTWGRNSSGQLGLGDTTDRHIPTPVTSLDRKKTVSISCGKDHTVILTQGGVVFTFGGGRYGQLGHNTRTDEHQPRVVAELSGSKVTQVACGRHHTLALVDSGKVYSFGCGEHGQLGNGILTDQSVPLPVQISQESDENTIKRIFAGGNHSFAMTTTVQNMNKVIQKTLDNERVDEWIAKCDTKWKRIQMEIKATFSSSSCLNRSFLDKSNKHYETSSKYSGLDLSLAGKVFKKLAKKEKVLAEIKTVVLQSLLPTLNENPLSVESLRVYLVLSEFIRATVTPHQIPDTEFTVAVAAAILRLHPNKLQILGDLWSSLKPSTLIKQIKVWKDTLSYILRSFRITIHNRTEVKELLGVLQHLFTATQRAGGTLNIPVSAFCMENIVFDLKEDVKHWRLWSGKKEQSITAFVMNLQCKKLVLHVAASLSQEQLKANHDNGMRPSGTLQHSSPYLELRLSRASLIADTFRELNVADPNTFKKPLVVYFDGDSKVSDVYRKDFFLHVLDSLLDPDSKMFMYNETKTLAWFPAMPLLEEKSYFLFGVLCGLALHSDMVIHLPFPLALFKKLLNCRPSLEDLLEFSSDGRILKDILEYPDDVVENLDITFTVNWDNTWVALDSKEPEKLVTAENRMEFSEAYVNHVFNKSVEGVFAEFRRGFFSVCEEYAVLLFRPEELRAVMVGSEDYDWEKLKQNTVYIGIYNAAHPTIVIFWKVFEELSEEKKRAFLLFLTGCPRVPILGMDQIRMQVQHLEKSSQHFPEALTCHAILLLPMYQTKKILKARLTEAVSHNRGFWKD